MNVMPRIPTWVRVLFAADVALVVAPAVDYLVGSPLSVVRNWLNLDSEFSLPAWYSSMQWLCAAVLFGLVPAYLWKRRLPGVWALGAFALLCFAFSIDEILGIHEWLGRQSDALLPGGTRQNTFFLSTGIWPVVIGIPVLAILAALLVALKRVYARGGRRASRKLVVGIVVMFSGALLVELAKNLVAAAPESSGMALPQLIAEEFMEMVGVTIITWAAYDFAVAHGFELRFQGAATPQPVAERTVTVSSRPLLEPAAQLIKELAPLSSLPVPDGNRPNTPA
jgi:hypothetical protein